MKVFPNNITNKNAEYFDIRQLSSYLGITVSTLYSLAAKREIPHYKVGRLLRFKKSDIDLWMEGKKRECIDITKEASKVIKSVKSPTWNINDVVKKAIAEANGAVYNASHGKPDQVKGLGKEVRDGSF